MQGTIICLSIERNNKLPRFVGKRALFTNLGKEFIYLNM